MPELRKVKNNAPANHAPIIRENCASHEINAPRTAVNKKNAPESASTLHVRHLRHPRSRHLGERHVAHRRRAGLGEAAPAVEAAGGTGVGGVNVGSERTAATGTLGNLVRFLFFFQMQISSVSTTTNGVTDQKIRKP
jgi:hypothetical protein